MIKIRIEISDIAKPLARLIRKKGDTFYQYTSSIWVFCFCFDYLVFRILAP